MDADRPHDRDKDKGNIEDPGGLAVMVLAVEQVATNMEVEYKIAVEHDDVPRQERDRKVKLSDNRNKVPEPVRPPQVYRNENEAHNDGADSE